MWSIHLVDEGEPFRWDEARRAQLRAELDAYFFHLYGNSAEDADYILDTFQWEASGLRNNEIAKYGEHRAKLLVLTEYERMATAGLSRENALVDGESYASLLTPPPGHGPRPPRLTARPRDRNSTDHERSAVPAAARSASLGLRA